MLLDTKIPVKFLYQKVRKELIFATIYVSVVAIMHEFIDMPKIPVAVPGLLGTGIAIMLGFRTNQAYNRWWEARKIWGGIVNDSRTLIRQVVTFTHFNDTDDLKMSEIDNRFVNRQVAWCYCLAASLRRQDPLPDAKKYLTDKEYEYVSQHANVPNAILMRHGYAVKHDLMKGGKIDRFEQIAIDGTLTRLTDHMGKCERIKNTVFPKTYTLFVEFLLWLFIILLPFGIMEYSSWFQVFFVILLTMPYFLLERTAIYMQNPFENQPTDTPMTTLSRTIELNLHQMIQEELNAKEPLNREYYQM